MQYDPKFGAFFMLTGVTFMSFASGFGVCLFDLNTVKECVDVADSWVVVFQRMGEHVLAWGAAMMHEVFNR